MIADRVIQESRSLLETQHLAAKASTSQNDVCIFGEGIPLGTTMISRLVVAFVKAEFMSPDILMHWYMVLRAQYMALWYYSLVFCLIELQRLWFCSIGNDHASSCPSFFVLANRF